MTYIENIFICIAIPLILSLFFRTGKERRFTAFVIVGMGICLLSAYVSSFFVGYYGAGSVASVVEITPVCEEVMKVLPLLFYLAVFEPNPRDITSASLGIAVGFGTFETRERKARQGRNPRKPGEIIKIAASKAPVFKAGKALKDSVNK